jgi:urea ABC transporter ATP-binding protein UrtE
MLEVKQLHSGYGRIPILRRIELRVARGEVLGVLGHNGMGKTTLMKTLIGLLPASAGTIRLNGDDITADPPFLRARKGMGYVAQGRHIFPGLTVVENLRMGCAKSDGSGETVVDAVLERFPKLKPLLARRGGALSGGEQQLLALARCLCGSPRIILLDEPSEGIQPSIVEEIAEVLAGINEREATSIVLVEQNVQMLSALADRVLIMQRGEIRGELSGDVGPALRDYTLMGV